MPKQELRTGQIESATIFGFAQFFSQNERAKKDVSAKNKISQICILGTRIFAFINFNHIALSMAFFRRLLTHQATFYLHSIDTLYSESIKKAGVG